MKLHEIESSKNSVFRDFTSLLSGQGISEHNQALIFGQKAIASIMSLHPNVIAGLIVDKAMETGLGLEVDVVYRLTSALFKELDIFGTKTPILVVKTPKFKSVDKALSGCSLLLTLQDPSNVGALLRSAAGFGVNQIVLGPGCAHPFHPKSSRATSGTLFLNTFYQIKNLEELKGFDLPILALDMKGDDLKTFKFPKNFILMPGQEGPGLIAEQRALNLNTITIPLAPAVDSLNAMVATSIALYAWRSHL